MSLVPRERIIQCCLSLLLLCAVDVFAEQPIRLGAAYPLTGPVAVYGNAQLQGAQLAVEVLNAAGGIAGRRLELIVEDNGFDAKRQVSAVRKLLSQDRVDVLLTGWTPLTLPIVSLIDQSKVPTFTWSVADLGHLSPYLFNIKVDFTASARQFVQIAAREKIMRVALLTLSNDESLPLKSAIQEEATRRGVQIVSSEEFPMDAQDMRSILIRSKARAPQAIFLAGYPGNWNSVVKQISELGLDNLRLFDLSMSAPDRGVNQSMDGIMARMRALSNWYSVDPKHPTTAAFLGAFRRRFEHEAQPYAAYSYDTVKLLFIAAGRCHTKDVPLRECLVSGLSMLGTQDGAAGTGTMGKDGDFELPSAVVRYNGNYWQYIDPF